MRLATIQTATGPRLHALIDDTLVDLSDAAPALEGVVDVGTLLRAGDEAWAAAQGLVEDGAPGRPRLDPATATFCSPVLAPGKILCIAMNYVQHAEEGPEDLPEHPLIFAKFTSSLTAHGAPVCLPPATEQVDWEGELAFVIGAAASAVGRDDAMRHVAGYTIVNDLTARDVQFGDGQWTRGKSFDGFCPLGPYFVSADEVPDPRALRLQTLVNGTVRQDVLIDEMVHDIPRIVEYVSESITLQPGDVIATGTPAGCALGLEQPDYLKPGDEVDVTITGLGTLKTPITA